MKKAAILTLHFYDNFGSVLQAYALKMAVERMGWAARISPFRPNLPRHIYFSDAELLEQYKIKQDKFKKFREESLRVFEPFTAEITDTGCDAYIVGSDIVWGAEFSGVAPAYFLDFVHEGKKKISYAASVVLNKDGHTENDGLFERNLPLFSAVSVRERSAVQAIEQFAKQRVADVLDPTLLLTEKDYAPLVRPFNDLPDSPYMLSYFLTHDPATVDWTNVLAEKFGLVPLHFFADYPGRVFAPGAKCFAFAGPGEFLDCVKNARFVFTNSYHGTCFSIIFGRPFYTYTAKRGLLSRVIDLTERLGLEERRFRGISDLRTANMDMPSFNSKWSAERERSLEFLRAALEG